jgi:cyanate lyase
MSQVKLIRSVATNDRGMPIGKFHHNCKHTDEEIDHIRELHEDKGLSYLRIAKMLGLSKSFVACICQYQRRATTYENWKTIAINPGALKEMAVAED